MKAGDKVKYRNMDGEVKSVMGDGMVLVQLPDGKEYPLTEDVLTISSEPLSVANIAATLKPHLKDMNFLNALAQEMSKAGVGELVIRGGSIQTFNAKESLEEKTARFKAEALAEAELRAREEYERENIVVK